MSFTRDDLVAYETQPAKQVEGFDPFNPSATPATVKPEASPQANNEEAEVDAAIAASVTEPTEKGENDGSTTENLAEPVAAETATPEGEKDPDLEVAEDGKPRSRAQERIEELVAERNALRKYGEYLLKQVEGIRTGSAGSTVAPAATQESAPAATKAEDDPAPTLESADYDPVKLSKLQNDWINRQVKKQVESAVKTIETRQSEQAIRQAFEQRTAKFRESSPDFDMVIANPALPSLAPEAARAVVRSEQGPAIAYHLAKNPDLAARISRLEPVSQAVAIGRLEEQLSRAKTDTKDTTKEPSKTVTKTPVKVTQAPPPPKPVQGSTSPSKDPNIMSMDEWVANERARKLKERTDKLSLRKAMRR